MSDAIAISNRYLFGFAHTDLLGSSLDRIILKQTASNNNTSVREAIKLDKIDYNGKTLSLNRPIILAVEHRNGYFFIDYPIANIYIVEKSFWAAVKAFQEEFIFDWEEYAEEADENLSEDAIIFKRWLHAVASRG